MTKLPEPKPLPLFKKLGLRQIGRHWARPEGGLSLMWLGNERWQIFYLPAGARSASIQGAVVEAEDLETWLIAGLLEGKFEP